MPKHSEHPEDGGAWEIALADLMTTLMIFFLVMWLISIVDPADREAFVKGVEDGATGPKVEKVEVEKASPVEEKAPITTEEITDVMAKVNSKDIDIEETPEGIKITLRSDSFFESGRATLNDKTLEQLEQLGESLNGRNQSVKITGYTDSIPIENLQFPSNWELSAARAATVARTFIYMGLDQKYLTIQGKADNEPVAPNDNAYGRSLNRRVIILVSNEPFTDVVKTAQKPVAAPAPVQQNNRYQQPVPQQSYQQPYQQPYQQQYQPPRYQQQQQPYQQQPYQQRYQQQPQNTQQFYR